MQKHPSGAMGFRGNHETSNPFDAKSCCFQVCEAGFLTHGSSANVKVFPRVAE